MKWWHVLGYAAIALFFWKVIIEPALKDHFTARREGEVWLQRWKEAERKLCMRCGGRFHWQKFQFVDDHGSDWVHGIGWAQTCESSKPCLICGLKAGEPEPTRVWASRLAVNWIHEDCRAEQPALASRLLSEAGLQ